MTCMRLLEFMHGEGMGTSLLLLMNTLGLYIYIYIYIGNPMPLINSLNLRRNWITYWVNKLIHFNYIELAYLVGSIVSIGAWDYILVVCTYDSIIK